VCRGYEGQMRNAQDSALPRRKRMLVLCPFPQGVAAGQRLKYEQYFDDWRSAGWDIEISSFMDEGMWNILYEPGHLPSKLRGVLSGHTRRLRDMMRTRQFDLVYVFMWVTPVGTSSLEWLTRRLAKRLVFDVEDNVLVEQSLPRTYNPNAISKLVKGPWKARYLIRTADHVVTSSPFLNDFCLELNERRACRYISSSINTDRFLPANRYTNNGPVTVGWTGTFSSKIYLDMLRDVFQELARRVSYKLKVIGNFSYDLPAVDLEVVRWTKEREVEDLQSVDIGVYPLPMDEWVLGKSGLKAIQYMAFGLPQVATNVGTTPMLLRDGETGFLVKTEQQWLEALERLIRDPDLRRRLGEAARRDAVARYAVPVVAQQYRHVLEEVMGRDA
jgi:L-malate glycosyltransferase